MRHVTLREGEGRRLAAMGGVVLGLHVLGFGLLLLAVSRHPGAGTAFGLGTGTLAYTLGVRHAFDADHLAAIDSTTRALMAKGKRPLGIGFFFSLGHSTVVFALTALLALGVRAIDGGTLADDSTVRHYLGLFGTTVSASFLLVIAILNTLVLRSAVKGLQAMRRGEQSAEELEHLVAGGGPLVRLFRPLIDAVGSSRRMYPLGILFGLGFDTASEIALLVLAATAGLGGLPFWAILALPILFTAGMSLFDTLDGCFMNYAYGWALSRPLRKVYYNLTMTGLTVMVAAFIGGLEVSQVLAQQLELTGGYWDAVTNFDLGSAGYVLFAMFALVWAGSYGYWRVARVEQRWLANDRH